MTEDEMQIRLKIEIKNPYTGKVAHHVGDIIIMTKNKGWCGTYPWGHECPECGGMRVGWRIGNRSSFGDVVEGDGGMLDR